MKNLLLQVNQLPGIKGSMVITHDGIMVTSVLDSSLDEDTVAALSSSLVITVKRSFECMSRTIVPEELILSGELGKLLFFDLGRAFLVVVTQPHLAIHTDLVSVRSVASKLKSRIQFQN